MGTWDPWASPNYYWVVISKNTKVHKHTNLMFGHKIRLRETDAFESLPVSGPFLVQCDECGPEYYYEPAEVSRVELEPQQFSPHIPDSPEYFSPSPSIVISVTTACLLCIYR